MKKLPELKKKIRFIEKEYNAKFVNINESFVYRHLARKHAKKIGVEKCNLDKFLQNTSMVIPFFGIHIVVLSFRLDDKGYDIATKYSTIYHEFQHILDSKSDNQYRKKYLKNNIYRANMEGRGYSAGMDGYYYCNGEIMNSDRRISAMYFLTGNGEKIVKTNMRLTKKRLIQDVYTSESAKILNRIK